MLDPDPLEAGLGVAGIPVELGGIGGKELVRRVRHRNGCARPGRKRGGMIGVGPVPDRARHREEEGEKKRRTGS